MQTDIYWLYTYGLTLKQSNSVACIEVKLFMKLITFIDLLKRYKYFIETLLNCLKHIFEGGRHIINTISKKFLLIYHIS